MQSTAKTVEAYLNELPEDRREVIATVRKEILKNLPEGYEEAMNWGMITYQVPLATHSDTYNGQPLMFAALGSQKNYLTLYLIPPYVILEDKYGDTWLQEKYRQAGKKLDMGKSCIRFKQLDDLALDPIMEIIRNTSVEQLVACYQAAREVRKAKNHQ